MHTPSLPVTFEMKYSYTLVKAAALWMGIDPTKIQKRINANELKKTNLAHENAVSNIQKQNAEDLARWHQQEFDCASCVNSCPDWKTFTTEDGEERRTFNCPGGYRAPLTKTPPKPRPEPSPLLPSNRTTPAQGEFSDLPEFEKRLSWLQEATASQDLPKVPGEGYKVRRLDLQEWMKTHFPNEKPAFLFPELNQEPQEMVITDTSLLLVISALLKLLKNAKQSQENVAQDASNFLGAKFSDSKLTKIFAEANKALANRVATKAKK